MKLHIRACISALLVLLLAVGMFAPCAMADEDETPEPISEDELVDAIETIAEAADIESEPADTEAAAEDAGDEGDADEIDSEVPAPEETAASGTVSGTAVIGADLSEDEIASVYGMFGVERGTVTELTVTNSEEREYLEGKVDDGMIGSASISCVYIRITEEGTGLDVSTQNISWCSVDVYKNALITAGITDARVIIAAPFSVSGTAALTGIYKAYEAMTGETLDEAAKDVAVDELVSTSELADAIGSVDAAEIVNELKSILDETKNMTDDQLREEILSIAAEVGVELTEDQISQLISLVREMEKLDVGELTARVQSVKDTVQKLATAASSATGFFAKIAAFFENIGRFFQNLFGGSAE